MMTSHGYVSVKGSEHKRPKTHKRLTPCRPDEEVTVTLLLRRSRTGKKMPQVDDFDPERLHKPITRAQFAKTHGADLKDIRRVEAFARSHGLEIVATHPARRSLILRGPVMAMNKAFAVDLYDYEAPGDTHRYRGHPGPANVPSALGKIVEAVIGLTNRPVRAIHYRSRNSLDPPNTKVLTPQQVAALYDFPPGAGAGQTIGIYEMITSDGPPGYSVQDLKKTLHGFDPNLRIPTPIDVAVDGVRNSGSSDGETVLDITVAAAIAQDAKIAVYFTGPQPQSIIHALQTMIHPDPGEPEPTVISISYGWGADGDKVESFTEQEYAQLGKLFQDAASLAITVLISSGDSGAFIPSDPTIKKAQTSYPATEPWVIACGGTTIGNIRGTLFDEYAWNDLSNGRRPNPGASGGGVSARFPLPSYQKNADVPKGLVTGKPGRGIPDIAGNASENSGYNLYLGTQHGAVGGTSAVAPLYAGLIARINGNLGAPVGFINPIMYRLAGGAFRDIVSPPGPTDNSYQGVTGYPVKAGWDACTGLGSVKGTALQNGLKAAHAVTGRRAARDGRGARARSPRVFTSGPFRGVAVSDAFALAAQKETPITLALAPIKWPAKLAPKAIPVGSHRAGEKITDALDWRADVLVVLYTDYETSALLDVFTGDKTWNPKRKKEWCGYAHNFAKFKPLIGGIAHDVALKQGMFGYLSGMEIGGQTVALYKTELHPKQNGDQLPFVPVMQQLISELGPKLVISTGTAGAIGQVLNCGDVTITAAARFHCEHKYPNEPTIDTMSADGAELVNKVKIGGQNLSYAANTLTKLSLPGLAKCYAKLQTANGYGFVRKNAQAPKIYFAGSKPVPKTQMVTVSADYLSVDDTSDLEGLQKLGVMNDTDDAFLFYAIEKMTSTKPQWLSIRNASEPKIAAGKAPSISKIKSLAGRIYGIYQYCTTINSALACWGVIADL